MSVPLPNRRELIPYLILLAALLVAGATAYSVYQSGVALDRERFHRIGQTVTAAIERRIDAYIAMMLGGTGLFAASDDVTREEFAAYISRLELERRYPGIQGIGFSKIIHEHEREAVLEQARLSIPGFRYWPDPGPGEINAILYLEPPDLRNQHALGYDMGSEAVRREAMIRARDTGGPAASGKVRLVQEEVPVEGPEQAGFLIYVPVYRDGTVPATIDERRQQCVGFVYSPFRADDLLTETMLPEYRASLGLEVFDGAPVEKNLLHRWLPATNTGYFTDRLTAAIAGRTWTVVAHGGVEFISGENRQLVALIAGGGAALALMLFLFTRSQVLARADAERTAEELRRSEEKLRALDRERDAFLAIVSHELRTPLNAIVGWASMLGREKVPKDMQARAVEVIRRNAAAQTRLIEDLLDMSRAVTGHLDLRMTSVDASAVVSAAVDAVRPAVEEAHLTLDVDVPPRLGEIEADAGRLQQIIVNILSNAIKFTPPGGRVQVRAGREAGVLTVSVTDNGVGIDPEFLPHVFDRFKQADSSPTRSHSGVGLGLAIARYLVEMHGGTLTGESAGLNAGATFTVRIPASRKRRVADSAAARTS